ncbi:MAG TPA: flagellar hook protein FlgE [Rhodocyclaceae bacterium]
MGFQQGLSGLNSSSKALDVVGNNVSNSGTVGFKAARAEFADVFAASLSGAGGASQVGIGNRISSVAQQFSQGNITATSNALDVAINGNGFFIMSDSSGALSYTRNGQFQLDKNGYLVNADGLNVEGYPANYTTNSLGVINSTTPSNIYIDPTDLQPQVTTKGSINVNLDARSSIPPSGHESFSTSDPLSYNSSTSMSVYDSLGNVHTLSTYFIYAGTTNTGLPNQQSNWQVRYALDGVSNATAAFGGTDPWTTPALGAQPGTLVGGVYTAGAANAGGTLSLSVNGGAAQNLVIPAGTYTSAATLAAAINTAGLAGATASAASATGPIIITSSTTGATSSVNLTGNAFSALVFGTSNPTSTAGSTPIVPFPSGDNVTLSFDTSGKLVDYNHQGGLTPAPSLTIDLASVVGTQNKAATPMTINTLDYSSATQFGTTFGVNSLTQDGYPSGRLTKISISQDGVIQGNYTNGQTRNMAQIVLARFTNPNGLQSIGGNQWQETFASGVPLVGAPGSASNGLLQDSALEESTVDLTQELVDMITYQRAYQANAQTIKTQDSLLQTITNLR